MSTWKIICPTCENEQARCADCRQTSYRSSIRENFEYSGIPYRSRADIEDDTATKHRRLESELALKALSALQVIQAQQKGREEAKKRKQEAKAHAEEVERIRKEQMEKLYGQKLWFPKQEQKPFDFTHTPKTVWTNPPEHIPNPLDALSRDFEGVEVFKIGSSLYPSRVWNYRASSEMNARLQVARFLKISYSETHIIK